MMTLDEVTELAMSYQGVTQGERFGNRTWFVGKKAFAWHRPFSKADLKRFGDVPPPDGDILAVSVADLSEKEAVLAEGTTGVFTIEHFANYPAVLLQLKVVPKKVARELLRDAYRAVS